MNIFKHLLLAVDFSEHSKTTLQNAIQFAKKFDSKISIIHVITDFQNDHEKSYQDSRSKLKEVSEEITLKSINCPHMKISSGNVENETVAYAKEIAADLIIVGSGNKKNKSFFRLGGHSEAIIRNAETPSLVIKENIDLSSNQIACPVDLTESSNESLLVAIDSCKAHNLELVVIHCVEPSPFTGVEPGLFGYPGTGFDYANVTQSFFEDEAKAFDEFLKKVDFKGIKWNKITLQGQAIHQIGKYLQETPFLLTIMRSSTRSGISRLILGSVAESITKSCPNACLIIK